MIIQNKAPIAVIGAGIMGTGIAQIAAQSGHLVTLYDNREGAAQQALKKLAQSLQRLQEKGKFDAKQVHSILENISAVDQFQAISGASLVVEAIIENVDAKRSVLRDAENLVSSDCVLASNTSSLSITLLAQGLKHPERVVGMHFFNPVPVMQLVEVVSGLETAASIVEGIMNLARSWGKVPVHAKSTPGFIVNRIARPYYAETLMLLQENVGQPADLDACLRSAGFRMGPCELMDLIGHDTNFAVTNSVYQAFFYDKRYTPSLIQRELVDGGLLGRKTGRGFYVYDGTTAHTPEPRAPKPVSAPAWQSLQVAGSGDLADRLEAALHSAGLTCSRLHSTDWMGVCIDGAKQLRLTDGRTASSLGAEIAVFDQPIGEQPLGTSLAYATSIHADPVWRSEAPAWLQILGFTPIRLEDSPGLIVARTIAMLINEAADAIQQGVCSPSDADTAMKLGVNYPAGPFEWLQALGTARVVTLLDALDHHYRGERYRVSPWLRLRSSQRRCAWK